MSDPLPETMVGRPFGVDEAGRPLNRTKGNIVVATVTYLLDCVEQRTARSLPPGISTGERDARIAQAKADAFAQLLARLNAAIADPRYHVTADYLMNEGNSYSVEFDAFLSEICRDLSGDARFHFHRGASSISASVLQLARPFSLRQVYSLLPRFAAKFAATEFRVGQVTANSAVIQWHAANDLAHLPAAIHRLFLDYSCQYIQGTFSSIPQIHSGLPMAAIRELYCQLKGDPYCEWEFTWVNPRDRSVKLSLGNTSDDRAPQTGMESSRPTPVLMERQASRGRGGSRSEGASPLLPPPAYPTPVALPDEELPPLPPFIKGPPFGSDRDGRPIRQITGAALIGSIRQMHDYVSQQTERNLPADLSPGERRARISQAQAAALDHLVERLNAAIPDARHRVTRDYLLDESNYYSHEFNLYLTEFARAICGDPNFHFHRGLKSIPSAAGGLVRPLSMRQVYALLPRLAARVTEADFRVVSTTATSAVIQWHPARQLAQMPPDIHTRYLHMECQAYRGAFAVIPQIHSHLPLAQIRERRCVLAGNDCCEWEFAWEQAGRSIIPEVWGGALLTAALLAYTLARLPGWEWIAVASALLPAAGGWLLWRHRKLADSHREAEKLLLETRDAAETQYDDFQQTNANLQLSNVTLNQKLAELTALHEIGLALSATLDVDELLDKSLQAVTAHLSFDRALILLVEERAGRRVLTYGRLSNSSPEMDALLAGLEISLEGTQSFVAEVVNSGRPMLVHDAAAEVEDAATRAYLAQLQTNALLAVPLITQGRAVGLLGVDNALTGRPIPDTIQDLLFTVGAQIAAAVDGARLYQNLEQRVTARTAELAAATRRAEDAAAAIAQADREKDAALAETKQRMTELAVINSIQQVLASNLDLQSLIDLVGDQLRAVFGTQDIGIRLYDPVNNLLHYPYEYDHGQRLTIEPQEPSSLSAHVLKTQQLFVANRDAERCWAERGWAPLPGTTTSKSIAGAPIVVGGQANGIIVLDDYEKEDAFTDSDLRLLQTLASSIGVAVNNARLFTIVQESERRLTDIINFLPDATVVIDSEGRVIAWNRAMEEMTGIPAQGMLGKGNHEYAIPFYGERRPVLVDLVFTPREELVQKYAQLRWHGSTLVGETYAPHLPGGGRHLLATASILRDPKGDAIGAIETVRDVTERKRAEKELQQAKEVAEAATQAKSAFLAMMSHEIRTPMNAIIGMSGLLLDTPLSPDQHDFAETIRTSGDALLTIINDILDFSKIEAGKMDLEQQPFDLRECVESALDLVRIRAAEKGLELAYQVDPDVPAAIVGDVTRLRQVLVNLLSNAVKFTETGEVVVSVKCGGKREDVKREEGQDTDHASRITYHELHFAVRDTGIGIPPDRLDRLFQAFSQVDASTARRYGGTGLGLAVSKRLSEMMGGAMWAESEGTPGAGSTFHFTITAAPAPDYQPRPHLAGTQPQLASQRVLIVDDNATNRRILTLQTQNWGMLPRATDSPLEALGWLRQGDAFDVAILDLHMPEMNGVELAAAIRSVEAGAPTSLALPLILTSSVGGREAAAFAAYLAKPIRPSALFEILISVLAARPTQEARPAAPKPVFDPNMAARHPLRILLAEDNAVNQKLALRLLGQMGYRADVAANGIEAMQAVERQGYDVILMDVQMPEMDGLEATRAICARWAAGVRPRIIAMTANAMQGDRELCLEAGMDDYLSKPIRVEELVAALERASASREVS